MGLYGKPDHGGVGLPAFRVCRAAASALVISGCAGSKLRNSGLLRYNSANQQRAGGAACSGIDGES